MRGTCRQCQRELMLLNTGRCIECSVKKSRGGRVSLTTASNIKSKRVKWLWKGYNPLGYLTISSGETKLGKTTFAAYEIAAVTNGELDGEYQGEPQNVLVIAAEDGLEDLWKPRLVAAGADLDRVAFVGFPDDWNVRDGIGLIEAALEDFPAKLVFVDAVMEHLPAASGGENSNSAVFVRGALRPFARVCGERSISGHISTHPPKGRGGSFVDAYHGSGAFVQLSRSARLYAFHPEDGELAEDQRRRVMLRAAGNIGRDPGALSFRIGGKTVDLDDGDRDEIGYVYDVVPCEVTVRDLLNADKSVKDDDVPTRPKVDVIAGKITAYLADGNWHPSIRSELESEGFAGGTIHEARKRVAKARKMAGTMNAGWEWKLRSSNSPDSSTLLNTSRARGVSSQPDSSTLRGVSPVNKEASKSRTSSTNDGRSVEESVSANGLARVREPDDWTQERADRLAEEYEAQR